MKKNDVDMLLEKKVKIFLKNNMCFTGYIDSVNDENLIFIDKFSSMVIIDLNSISNVMEIQNE